MKLKDKRNEALELHTGPIQSHAEDTSANHTPSSEGIRLRAYEIYLERGGLQAMSLMIGCKPRRELERVAPPKTTGFSIKRETQ